MAQSSNLKPNLYQSLPVGHIRTLNLRPGPLESDPINVTLEAVPLDNPGQYEALSYVWGSSNAEAASSTIFCNGHEITVTPNLFDALHRFRRSDESRRMWIDALCINQSDDAEKSEQVKRMLEIYQNAERTLIWMGPSDENGDEDIESMFDLATIRYAYALCNDGPPSPSDETDDVFHLSDEKMGSIYKTVLRFFRRPYWRRAWILQEAMVSKENLVVCGDFEVDFTALYNIFAMDSRHDPGAMNYSAIQGYFGQDKMRLPAVRNFMLHEMRLRDQGKYLRTLAKLHSFLGDDNVRSPPEGWSTMSMIGSFRLWLRGASSSLAGLLQQYTNQQATNQRDLIFSLLGLVRMSSQDEKELEWCKNAVDYSLPVGDVFRNAAQHIVETYTQGQHVSDAALNPHILDFLPRRDAGTDFDLPSWVPNWSSPTDRIWLENRRRYEMAGFIPYRARVDGESLFIQGHIVDTLHQFSEVPFDESNERHPFMYEEVRLLASILDSGQGAIYGDADAVSEAFWRTIVADDPKGDKQTTDNTFSFQEHNAIQQWVAQARQNFDEIRQKWKSLLGFRHLIGPVLSDIKNASDDVADGKLIALGQRLESLGLDEPTIELLVTHAMSITEPAWPAHISLSRGEMTPHKFVVTEKGYFGLAPVQGGLKTGDVVALIGGAKKPWLLRGCQEGGGYRLLAPGWVFGVMYREDGYYTEGWGEGRALVDLEIR